MRDLATLFERQAAWQRSRAALSRTEKLRLAKPLRDLALSMRRPKSQVGTGVQGSPPRNGERGRP
jgi:hypothetical protein